MYIKLAYMSHDFAVHPSSSPTQRSITAVNRRDFDCIKEEFEVSAIWPLHGRHHRHPISIIHNAAKKILVWVELRLRFQRWKSSVSHGPPNKTNWLELTMILNLNDVIPVESHLTNSLEFTRSPRELHPHEVRYQHGKINIRKKLYLGNDILIGTPEWQTWILVDDNKIDAQMYRLRYVDCTYLGFFLCEEQTAFHTNIHDTQPAGQSFGHDSRACIHSIIDRQIHSRTQHTWLRFKFLPAQVMQ